MTGCPANASSSSAVKILAGTRPFSGWNSAMINSNCRISKVSAISASAPAPDGFPKSTIKSIAGERHVGEHVDMTELERGAHANTLSLAGPGDLLEEQVRTCCGSSLPART